MSIHSASRAHDGIAEIPAERRNRRRGETCCDEGVSATESWSVGREMNNLSLTLAALPLGISLSTSPLRRDELSPEASARVFILDSRASRTHRSPIRVVAADQKE